MGAELALVALHAADQAGITVPDHMAVTGWDAAAAPARLTTVHHDLRVQGGDCARIIKDIEARRPSSLTLRFARLSGSSRPGAGRSGRPRR